MISLSREALDEFTTEIPLLSILHHQNIIRLLEYCIHEQGSMLLYEFMENGSFAALLFGWSPLTPFSLINLGPNV